ncbi:MAG TPA: AAA family ATPase [Plasticicumulans sp.]|nr:AAA family ATPase [Plasticicumulans sp.]
MLTRIEIDGFKSFENFSIDLAPFVAILGTNAAGKSNLFDAIQLLSNLATQDVSSAVKQVRGEPLELFRLTSRGHSTQIRFAVEALIDPKVTDPWGSQVNLSHTRIRYEVVLERRVIRSGVERVMVASEAATPILRNEDDWARGLKPSSSFRTNFLKYKRTRPFLTTDTEPQGPTFNVHQDGKAGRNRPASAAEATVLYSITNTEFPHLFALREEMRNWRLLQLDPVLLRRPAPLMAPDLLTSDGANLAAVLTRLKVETATDARPQGVIADIETDLGALIPGIQTLDAKFDETTREYRIELTMKDGLPYSSRVVSDGTLRILALLTLLNDPQHRGLVCFEEPENGVHPARLKKLIGNLLDVVTHPGHDDLDPDSPLCQLLLNSHSPVVLSALLDRDLNSAHDPVLFADVTSIIDPAEHETRRHTRLRPVMTGSHQENLLKETTGPNLNYVSHHEVRQLLDTVNTGA